MKKKRKKKQMFCSKCNATEGLLWVKEKGKSPFTVCETCYWKVEDVKDGENNVDNTNE